MSQLVPLCMTHWRNFTQRQKQLARAKLVPLLSCIIAVTDGVYQWFRHAEAGPGLESDYSDFEPADIPLPKRVKF